MSNTQTAHVVTLSISNCINKNWRKLTTVEAQIKEPHLPTPRRGKKVENRKSNANQA